MKKLVPGILAILAVSLVLFVLPRTFKIPHQEVYHDTGKYIYGKGNAPLGTRQEILKTLAEFQKGYTERDASLVESFADSLFSKENLLILGTLPNEYFPDYPSATELIRSDWLSWGDVKLLVDNSNISLKDNAAWFATIGYVEFDLFKYLVLPLRVTGILVNEEGAWKFQQVQFQFDLDHSMVLFAIILLAVVLLAMIIRLAFLILRTIVKKP